MEDNGIQGVASLGWQDLCKGPLDIALYQIYKLWAEPSMARTLMAHSPFKVLCLWELYVAHGH